MIQVVGTKKCKDTQKALRFFQERGVKVQTLDPAVKPLSPGELESIARSVAWEKMIDVESKTYVDEGLRYHGNPPRDLLLKYPSILRTPVVRASGKAVIGNDPAAWRAFADAEKNT